jgi:hypothetical protein
MEGSQHARYVARIKAMAKEIGAQVLTNDSGPHGKDGWAFPQQITGKGPRSWIMDVMLSYNGRRIGIEVDGKIGHSSKHAYNEDNYRDDFMEYHYGIRTIRYNTKWVKDLDAEKLKADLHYAMAQDTALERYAARMST